MNSERDTTSSNFGGKIYLPQSVLLKLSMLHISYPMLFEIRNKATKKLTHGGVLEFTAEEGRAYLPEWMMKTLEAKSASLIQITTVSLELGTFVKIEPQSPAFLEVTDPKAVLENTLRNFTTLTIGDVFQIYYNDRIYDIKVLGIKPDTGRHAICVVETDIEVDFAPPKGYVDPSTSADHRQGKPSDKTTPARIVTSEKPMAELIKYKELVNKNKNGSNVKGSKRNNDVQPLDASLYADRSASALELPVGYLFFGYPINEYKENDDTEGKHALFAGDGIRLRDSKKMKG